MCNIDIEDIAWGDGCANEGGLKVKAWYALYADVDDIPAPLAIDYASSATVASDITMKAGKYFRPIYSDLEASSFAGESQGETSMLSSANRYTFKQFGTRAQLVGMINALRNKSLIIIVEDLAGNKRIIGSMALPAKMESFGEIGGAKASDEKSVAFTIYAPGKQAYFYTGEIPIDPGIPLNAIVDELGDPIVDEFGDFLIE